MFRTRTQAASSCDSGNKLRCVGIRRESLRVQTRFLQPQWCREMLYAGFRSGLQPQKTIRVNPGRSVLGSCRSNLSRCEFAFFQHETGGRDPQDATQILHAEDLDLVPRFGAARRGC